MRKYILKYENKEIEVGEGEYLLGRSKDCQVKFLGESVSRKHAKLRIEGDNIYIEDIGSSNGTFVNGRLVRSITSIHPEDRIHLGKVVMIIKEKMEEIKEEILQNCPQCHNKIRGGMKFCTNCGAMLIKEEIQEKVSDDSTKDLPKEMLREAIKEPVVIPTTSPPEPKVEEIREEKLKEDTSKEYAVKLKPFKSEAAGFWIRLLACFIDAVILSFINLIIGIIVMAPSLVLNIRKLSNPNELLAEPPLLFIASIFLFFILLFSIGLYYVLHGPAVKGGTPGKRMLNLRIYTTEGETPIGWQKAFIRFLGYLLSSLIFCIGFLMIAFRDDKKALHDLLAKTIVLKEKR